MLETIREYAAELFEKSDDADELRRKHAEHFLDLDGQAELGFRFSAYDEVWLDRLEAGNDDLRAALSWALDAGQAELVLRASLGLSMFWSLRDHLSEGRVWAEEVLAHCGDLRVRADLRARGLLAAGRVAMFTDEFELARERSAQALALLREVGDKAGVAVALMALGGSVQGDDPVQADALYAESLAIFKELGVEERIAGVLHLRGELARDRREFKQAEHHLRRSIEMSRRLRLALLAATVHSLADLLLDEGRYDEAKAAYEESLVLSRERDVKRVVQYCLAGLASVAAAHSDAVRAGRLWGAAQALELQLEAPMLGLERARYERALALLHAEPVFEQAIASGRGTSLDEAVEYALESREYGL